MINTAAELYSELISDFALSEYVICDLHKPCNKPSSGHRCSMALSHKLIDFDKVKAEYCKRKGESPNASTDGFTYKKHLYCFVELKGWADFLKYHIDPSTLEAEIKEQAEKYNLGKKLSDSMFVCKCVAENENIFKDAAIAFILVTDIDTGIDGPTELYADLMSLAETPTNWLEVCNRELKGKLEALPTDINTYYTKCQDFDEIISKL